MEYLEIDIKLDNIDPYTEIVIAMLNEIGFDSYIESLEGLKAYIKNDLFDKCIFNETMLKLDGLVGLTYHILQLEDNNWNKEWENNFSPVHISDNCVVRAPFHSSYDIKYEIIITPKMSFGTGHHSTTLLMMQYMFSIDFIDKEVLDLGSGTAILSILASKIGAISVDAIDNDNWAYTNAQENIMLNKASNIRCLCGEIDSILDRKSTIEEIEFLKQPGSKF